MLASFLAASLSGMQAEDRVTWTGRMKEEACLLSVDGGHRRTESAHDFHEPAQGGFAIFSRSWISEEW